MIFQPYIRPFQGRVSGATPLMSCHCARRREGLAARSITVAANSRTDVLQRSNRGHGREGANTRFIEAPGKARRIMKVALDSLNAAP
jgi:hypothetical protein